MFMFLYSVKRFASINCCWHLLICGLIFHLFGYGSCEESEQAGVKKFIYPAQLTTNNVRFASTRCQDNAANGNVTLKSLWSRHVYPNQQQTHSYIKCFLRHLGLIDLKTRGIDTGKLYIFWEKYDMNLDVKCLRKFDLDEQLDDLSISYYKKWMQFRWHCPDLVKHTFYEYEPNETVLNEWVVAVSKSLGESATEFCNGEKKFNLETLDGIIKEIELQNFKRYLFCIFRNFHYFDAYGRLVGAEIERSFEESKHLSKSNAAIIKTCTHQANVKYNESFQGHCEMAYAMWSCLQTISDTVKEVYKQRDATTRQY